jgi:hypothetical protein
MKGFAADGDVESFVCAAGIMSHYVGDACQPLHISFMFDGDPNDTVRAIRATLKPISLAPPACTAPMRIAWSIATRPKSSMVSRTL